MELPYTETVPYTNLVARFNADVDRTRSELASIKALLKEMKRRRRGEPLDLWLEAQRRRRNSLASQLETRTNKLVRLDSFKVPLWYLVEFLSAASGELWTVEQASTWSKELAAHEGRGEKALRLRHGLSLVPSTEDCDITLGDGTRIEVKNLQGRSGDGKFNIQDIQTGKTGRKVYARWMVQQAEIGRFKGLSEQLRDAIFTGELGRGSVYGLLPDDVMVDLLEVLRPHNVLGSYDAIVGTTRFGSITIPRADFDEAWILDTVTKMGPKYSLKRDYIVGRLKRTLVSVVPVAA
jgi:hypothetical protein